MPDEDELTPEERAALGGVVTQIKYISTRLALSMLSTIADLAFESGEVGRNIDLVLLGMAVFAADHEGRPLTIYKASLLTGTPRATAQRKIEVLIRSGCLSKDGNLLRLGPKWKQAALSPKASKSMYNLIVSAYRSIQAIDGSALQAIQKLDVTT